MFPSPLKEAEGDTACTELCVCISHCISLHSPAIRMSRHHSLNAFLVLPPETTTALYIIRFPIDRHKMDGFSADSAPDDSHSILFSSIFHCPTVSCPHDHCIAVANQYSLEQCKQHMLAEWVVSSTSSHYKAHNGPSNAISSKIPSSLSRNPRIIISSYNV